MAILNTFYELAIANAGKQAKQVDAFTNEANIWNSIPMMPASHGMRNVYEEVKSAVGADFVEADGILTSMSSDFEMAQTDLSIFGGIMEVGVEQARALGGKEAYFARKLPSIMRESAMALEKNVFYNKLRAYAINNSKHVKAGGSSNTNYSIVSVTWVEGDMTGLYDQTSFSNGKVFNNEAIGGGNTYKDSNGKLVYGMSSKLYSGIQLANPRYISSIVNIDTSNLPTVIEMDQMLNNCRAGSQTVIYMSSALKTLLGSTYKWEKMNLMPSDSGINTMVDSWGSIPIVTSYNLLDGTEPNVA